MTQYPKSTDFQGATFIGKWGKTQTPIYDVPSMHSLNQLVGYVKHINAGNGTVLYRGQCKLYEKVIPSIKHDLSKEYEKSKKLNNTIENVLNDNPLKHFLGLKKAEITGWHLYESLVVEAMLQHYGATTYCVDFVDNHWTALWFGLYEWNSATTQYKIRSNSFSGEDNPFIAKSDFVKLKPFPPKPEIEEVQLNEGDIEKIQFHSSRGSISYDELEKITIEYKHKGNLKKWESERKNVQEHNRRIDLLEKSDHLFLFLYVSETIASNVHGIYLGDNTYVIDLRKALPSTFLRPCSQHGWIVRGKEANYDFNKRVVCIIRISVDLAREMLGNGTLLSQENFFPNETIDQGYRVLLERQIGSRLISKHKKILPRNTIVEFRRYLR